MNLHQKRGMQMYIRPKYTTLQNSFLIFNSQLKKLVSCQKNLRKCAATVVFGKKVSQIMNSSQTFLFANSCCRCAALQTSPSFVGTVILNWLIF